VNTIAGGFACEGCFSSTRKKHLRAIQSVHSTTIKDRLRIPPILFRDDDFSVIDPTQDDLMVVIIEIEKISITKGLVDHSSLVNILY